MYFIAFKGRASDSRMVLVSLPRWNPEIEELVCGLADYMEGEYSIQSMINGERVEDHKFTVAIPSFREFFMSHESNHHKYRDEKRPPIIIEKSLDRLEALCNGTAGTVSSLNNMIGGH